MSNSLSEFIDGVVANVNQDTIANAQASAAAAAASATAAASSASQASQASTTSAANSGSSGQSATWASQSATAAAAAAAESLAAQQAANQSYANTQAALAAFQATATALTGFMTTYKTYFLGAGAADPTQDGNGNSLREGAMYENTTSHKIRVYSGTQWNDIDYTIQAQLAAATASATAAASSATAAAGSATAAGASATLSQNWASQASGVVNGTSSLSAKQYAGNAATSATNAASSATAAAASATAAAGSATQAQTSAATATSQATSASGSATAASGSATAASTSAGNASTSATAASTSATNAANSATAAAGSATAAATSATNASNSAASIGAFGVLSGIVSVTNNKNLTSADYGKMYEIPSGSAGGYSIAAPAVVAGDTGKCFGICNRSTGAVTVTTGAKFFSSYGSNVATVTIPPNSTVIFQQDGTNFNGIAGSGAIGSTLVPTNAAQPGQWEALAPTGPAGGATFVLPGDATQQWAYFVANGSQQAAGVGAGGSGVLGPFTSSNPVGFCWRIG
jgi:hypothetical protein